MLNDSLGQRGPKTGSGLCGSGEVQAYLVPSLSSACVRCMSAAAMAMSCVGRQGTLSLSPLPVDRLPALKVTILRSTFCWTKPFLSFSR